ncbi:transcriptional regulator, TetR family [Nocardia amikacinitolerans]|uniref:Transcriptional regulator, TetR family n=1 Tax=Nocardia amikacinitolerans TaxID=756689 RepID=A0A285L0V9_9NOCA|nr:TetR/AcrR family transcriptional regulator [Nocardia amikacinitolerans]MCP2276083.1 transcriptional regulator, TetR family [Nocardia amikacinitolerans]SNY77071.1 transcriptional regulator, TetR family [Nocardia amikacinitolerans]
MARASSDAARPRRRYAKRLQPADRREQLLDTALRILAESGFAEVTIAAVAERGGVTRPVVYDLYANRDDLLRDLIARETARMVAATAHVTESGAAPADPKAALLSALTCFLSDLRSVPDSWRLVYYPIDGVPAALRAPIERARDELRAPLRRLLRDWLTSRPVEERADEVDLDVFVEIVQGAVQTLARQMLAEPERFDLDRILRVVDLLLYEKR